MKKMAMFIIFVVFGTIGLAAQESDQIKDQKKDQDRTRDRIILVDGDVLQIRDRDQIRLNDKITLNDGTIVKPNGIYIKDKVRLRLKDGSCLDMDGILYFDEYAYLQKLNKEYKNLNEAQIQERSQNTYHIMNLDGELYQIRNQSQNQLKQQIKLSNGLVVNPDGTYQDRERNQLRLREGECINMDGQMFRNTYMHRKMVIKKNMNKNKAKAQKKVQTKKVTAPISNKNMKKGTKNV